ncbi:MAG: hypothetical protein HOW97_31965 [Catenulispora sp.]|nr:hypothetical protein [Catenulispora sp.]
MLLTASVRLAAAATTCRRAGRELTSAATGRAFAADAATKPLAALRTAWSAGRALTNRSGLGFAACGGAAGEVARYLGVATLRRPAATAMAVDAFLARIEAAIPEHPNLATPEVTRIVEAFAAARPVEAALALKAICQHMGLTRALTSLSPISIELSALAGLLDANPFNDGYAWVTLLGGFPTSDPFLGIPAAALKALNPGPGWAAPVAPDRILAKVLAAAAGGGGGGGGGPESQAEPDISRLVDVIGALGNHGLVHLRRTACLDGTDRYLLLLPGTGFAKLSNSTPQDLIGAFDAMCDIDTTYTRAVRKVLEYAQVPAGAELMIVGHSLGGMTAMNLACDPDFVGTWRLTHVITVGSPIDNKRPADPYTRVVSLVNEHDVIPTLDGRGPTSPADIPDSWRELAWNDETYDYPLSHAPQSYSDALRSVTAGHHRETVNELIAEYAGTVVLDQPYMVRDR